MAILIPQAARIPQMGLDNLGPVEVPLSSPPARLYGRKFSVDRPGVRVMGVWECSVGRWQRTVMDEEFAHFISGSARFIPDGGEPIEIRAGDTIRFPPDSRGVWEITENVRKVYVVIYRRNLLKALWSRLSALLSYCGLAEGLPPDMKRDKRATPAPAQMHDEGVEGGLADREVAAA